MATFNQFLGFKKVLTGATREDNYLYFVRANASATEGEIWFNDTCYGKCRDTEIDDIKDALAGFLDGGAVSGQTVKGYVDSEIAKIVAGFDSTASGESADGKVSVKVDMENGELTGVTVTTTDIASATALTKEIADREAADTAITQNLQTTATTLYNMITGASDNLEEEIAQAKADAIATAETYTDEAIEALDVTKVSTGGTYVEVTVTEADGLITDVAVDDSAIVDILNGLDYSGVTANGQAIINVTEADGVITATQGDIAAEHVTVANTGFSGDNVEEVLAEIAAKVAGNEVEIDKLDQPCGTTYASSYILKDAAGNQLGDAINVAKDQFLKEAYLDSGQTLHLIMYNASGATTEITVDFSEMIVESEAGDGLQANGHVLNVVKDANSEDFLVVGSDSIAITGVTAAIEAAVAAEASEREDADEGIMSALTQTAATLTQMIENASAAAATEVTEDSPFLSVSSEEGACGQTIYTISTNDIASASATSEDIQTLTQAITASTAELRSEIGELSGDTFDAIAEEISARTAADNALDERLDAIEGAYITAVTVNGVDATVANNHATVTVDASDISGASVTGIATVSGDTVDEVLQQIVDKLSEAVAGSYSGVTSTGSTLAVTDTFNGNNIEFLKETADETTVGAGHLELAQNANHEWYGQMYWIDEETTGGTQNNG